MRVARCLPAASLTAVTTLCMSAPVAAVDLSPDATQILSDPAYLPAGRQLSGSTAFQFSGSDATHVLSQSLSYGLFNDVVVWGSASYAWPRDATAANFGVDAPTYSDRFEPTVGVTVRALDQHTSPFNLDLSAAAPGIFDAAVSWQSRDLTILGRSGAYHAGLNTAIDRQQVFDPAWVYFVQVQSQWRLTRELSFNAGITYTPSTGAARDFLPHRLAFEEQINFQLIPDRLVLQGGFKQVSLGEQTFTQPSKNLFGIGLLYSL